MPEPIGGASALTVEDNNFRNSGTSLGRRGGGEGE